LLPAQKACKFCLGKPHTAVKLPQNARLLDGLPASGLREKLNEGRLKIFSQNPGLDGVFGAAPDGLSPQIAVYQHILPGVLGHHAYRTDLSIALQGIGHFEHRIASPDAGMPIAKLQLTQFDDFKALFHGLPT
jgi:hypothetical protein